MRLAVGWAICGLWPQINNWSSEARAASCWMLGMHWMSQHSRQELAAQASITPLRRSVGTLRGTWRLFWHCFSVLRQSCWLQRKCDWLSAQGQTNQRRGEVGSNYGNWSECKVWLCLKQHCYITTLTSCMTPGGSLHFSLSPSNLSNAWTVSYCETFCLHDAWNFCLFQIISDSPGGKQSTLTERNQALHWQWF